MTISAFALAAALANNAPVPAESASNARAETIVVTASGITARDFNSRAEDEQAMGPDVAAFLAQQPGMALVDNGAISGQVQMRGLFGERIQLRINGQQFASGGPNAMDPAMHYAPMILLDRAEIARGISPVRDGPGLGGAVNAVLKQVQFHGGDGLAPQFDVSSQYRSGDRSYAIGGLAGFANERMRFGLIAADERGEDMRTPTGRIAATAYQRALVGAHAGFRTGAGELSVEYRRQETGRSGNPAFAMDIIYFKTDFARIGFEGALSDGIHLTAHASYAGVSHRMNNHDQRPAPAMALLRQSDTYANTLSGGADLRFGSANRHVRLGGDVEVIDKGYRLYNPRNPDFFIHPLDRTSSSRAGAFVEWRAGLGAVEAELGARIDHHSAEAGAPQFGPGVPAGPAGLARTFAAGSRDWSGTTYDLALRLWGNMDDFTPRLTLARKTRAPSILERYSWLPTEASGGLADGNIYVGSPSLRPETAWLAEAGLDWASNGAYARPVIYYRKIDDFIQGVPYDATIGIINTPVEMVSQANGDATPLRFANTQAEIWGADIAAGAKIVGPLRIDMTASYVRGKRRDIADNLYRMAPAHGSISLSWEAGNWGIAAEALGFAAQKRVSATNDEVKTKGYMLANLRGHVSLSEGLRVDLGLENLFNRYYQEHLAGYNRVAGSDVPLGARFPGMGRSAFVRLRWVMGHHQ
jgi:iron complex outermembrane receptor protein